jgi:hypothetical protein
MRRGAIYGGDRVHQHLAIWTRRLVAIARHYRSLAKIEQSIADLRPNKSVAANPHHFAMTEFTSVQQ